MQTINHKNELLAKFLGYKYYPVLIVNSERLRIPGWKLHDKPFIMKLDKQDIYLCRVTKDMKFHVSYDWLMRVINKINNYKAGNTSYRVSINPEWSVIYKREYLNDWDIFLSCKGLELEELHNMCYEFIKLKSEI